VAPATAWLRLGPPGSGSAELVAWKIGWNVALSGTVQRGDVVENVLGMTHPGDGQYHDPGRYQRDQYPELPRHRLTAPYSPRFPA
jgi:hypothetical protein